MQRCTPTFFCALLALAASTTLATLPARAQSEGEEPQLFIRNFPPAALRGEMVVLGARSITIDGKEERLSPNARIRTATNRLVRTSALVNQTLVVNYLRGHADHINEVWILNSEEIKQKRPNTKSYWFNFSDDAPAGITPARTKAP